MLYAKFPKNYNFFASYAEIFIRDVFGVFFFRNIISLHKLPKMHSQLKIDI